MALIKVFDTVTNRNTGIPIPGVTVRLNYADQPGVQAPIYADELGAQFPTPNETLTDEDGLFQFFADTGSKYDMMFYIGSSLYRTITDVTFAAGGSGSGGANSTYETTELLEAALTSNVSAILAEPGKAGTFTVRAYADFASQVEADPNKVNFIRSLSDLTKVWVRTTILDFGASQVGTVSGSNVQDELDAKIGINALITPAGPWTITAIAGQTDFNAIGSEDYEIAVTLNGQPLVQTTDYNRAGDVVSLVVPAVAGDIFEASVIRSIDEISDISLRASIVSATDPEGAPTNVQTELVKNATSITVIKDGAPLNALDFCAGAAERAAVLAGTIGIDIPLQAAINAAATAKRPVILPPGESFVTTPNAVITNPGVAIYGNGSTIRKVGTGPLFRVGTQTDPAMGGARLVAGTTSAGTLTVSVDSNAGQFQAYQWVIVTDRTRIFPLANNVRGELQLIQSVDAANNTITFWSPLKYDYLGGPVGGGYARIVAAPVVKSAEFRDLTVIMDPTISLATRGNNAFECNWLIGGVIENVKIRDFVEVGVYMKACAGCKIDVVCEVGGSATTGSSDPTSSEGLPGFSYGVCESGPCQGNDIHVVATNIRHAYSTAGHPLTGGTPLDYGEPYGSVISGIANFPVNAGFDTHESGKNLTFKNVKVNNGHYVGLQIRAANTTVKHLEVNDTVGCALWIRGGATTAGDNAYANRTVVGTVVARNTNLGISFDSIDWRERGAVADEASQTRGNLIVAMNVGGPALAMYRNGGNSGGYWRMVQAINPCQRAATNKYVVHIPSSFSTPIVVEHVHNVGTGAEVNVVRADGASGTLRNFTISSASHTGQTFSLPNGVTLSDSIDNITNLRAILNNHESRIAALEGA